MVEVIFTIKESELSHSITENDVLNSYIEIEESDIKYNLNNYGSFTELVNEIHNEFGSVTITNIVGLLPCYFDEYEGYINEDFWILLSGDYNIDAVIDYYDNDSGFFDGSPYNLLSDFDDNYRGDNQDVFMREYLMDNSFPEDMLDYVDFGDLWSQDLRHDFWISRHGYIFS